MTFKNSELEHNIFFFEIPLKKQKQKMLMKEGEEKDLSLGGHSFVLCIVKNWVIHVFSMDVLCLCCVTVHHHF